MCIRDSAGAGRRWSHLHCPTTALQGQARENRALYQGRSGAQPVSPGAVSYTHLDVYKRQTLKNVVALNRAALLQSMVRAAILTNEKFRGVRLVLSAGSMKIMAANAEQEEAQEEIEVDYSGDAIDVGFNVGYLLDVLNNTSVETVEWGFNDANSSALLSIPGNERFKYVVMPMRI